MQGQVAIYMDGVNFASQFEDAAKSKVIGKVGYAVLPSGPGGHFSPIYITAWRSTLRAATTKRPISSPVGHEQDQHGARAHGRRRCGPDLDVGQLGREGQAQDAADWYQAYQASLKIGRQGLPEIVGVTEYRDIIGVAIQKGIEGAPAAQVLAQAQKDFQDLLNRTES